MTEQMIEIADGNADKIFHVFTLEFREQGTEFSVIISGVMQQLADLVARPVLQFRASGDKAAGTVGSGQGGNDFAIAVQVGFGEPVERYHDIDIAVFQEPNEDLRGSIKDELDYIKMEDLNDGF